MGGGLVQAWEGEGDLVSGPSVVRLCEENLSRVHLGGLSNVARELATNAVLIWQGNLPSSSLQTLSTHVDSLVSQCVDEANSKNNDRFVDLQVFLYRIQEGA